MTLPRITLITSLLALVASTAFAGTIRVGPHRTYTTIQDGVDNASDGDTILIDKGVYVENVLVVMTANLTLKPAKKGKKGKVTISGGGSGNPLKFLGGADGCIAKDLTIVESKDYGIVFGQNTGVRIIGCTVSGGATVAGIEASPAVGALISKCKVTNVGGDGINIYESSGHVVTKCTVKGVGGYGIKVDDSDAVTISNNKIIGPTNAGIYLGESTAVKGCLVSGNEVVQSGYTGIWCEPFVSLCVFDKNTLRKNEYGVYTNQSTDCLWEENVCDDSLVDGFYLDGSHTTWTKNKCTDSGATNFYFGDSNPSSLILTKNKSLRAGDAGMLVDGTDHVLINNDSRKSDRSDSGYVDFDTSGGTDCVYLGNTYGTSDL